MEYSLRLGCSSSRQAAHAQHSEDPPYVACASESDLAVGLSLRAKPASRRTLSQPQQVRRWHRPSREARPIGSSRHRGLERVRSRGEAASAVPGFAAQVAGGVRRAAKTKTRSRAAREPKNDLPKFVATSHRVRSRLSTAQLACPLVTAVVTRTRRRVFEANCRTRGPPSILAAPLTRLSLTLRLPRRWPPPRESLRSLPSDPALASALLPNRRAGRASGGTSC